MEHLIWKPVFISKIYYLEFLKKYPEYSNNSNYYVILDSFTKCEIRLVEQALIFYLKPELNFISDVHFPVNWDRFEKFDNNRSFKPIKAIMLRDGADILSFPSINKASLILGISRKPIDTIINNVNLFTYCKNIDENCRFLNENLPLKTKDHYKERNPYNRENIAGIDFSKLPLGKVLTLNENYEQISIFDTSSEAAMLYGFCERYYKISRHINKSFIKVSIKGEDKFVLFVQNLLSKGWTKAVVKQDIITGENTLYQSINACVRSLNTAIDGSYFIQAYLKKNKILANRWYIFTYYSEYKGPEPTKPV